MSKTNYELVSAELCDIEYSISHCLKGMVWNSQSTIYCSEGVAFHNVNYLKNLIEEYSRVYLIEVAEHRKHLVKPDILGMVKAMEKAFSDN